MQLIFWDGTHYSSLKKGGPLPLQRPLASPVSLQTKEKIDKNNDRLGLRCDSELK